MRKEIRRQFLHYLIGSAFIAIVALYGVYATRVALLGIFMVGLLLSELIRKGYCVPLLTGLVKKVERGHEMQMPGRAALAFFLSAIMIMFLFPSPIIAIGALMVSTYGDSASTVFGIAFGRHRLVGMRTIEGTLGGILVSFAFLAFVFPLPIALAAAAVGMAAELLPFDDNFTIPFASAIMLLFLV